MPDGLTWDSALDALQRGASWLSSSGRWVASLPRVWMDRVVARVLRYAAPFAWFGAVAAVLGRHLSACVGELRTLPPPWRNDDAQPRGKDG